jgi:hypothetical protein
VKNATPRDEEEGCEFNNRAPNNHVEMPRINIINYHRAYERETILKTAESSHPGEHDVEKATFDAALAIQTCAKKAMHVINADP